MGIRISEASGEMLCFFLPSYLLAGLLYPRAAVMIGTSYFLGRSVYTAGYLSGGASFYVREVGAAMLFVSYASTIGLLLWTPWRVLGQPWATARWAKAWRFLRN